MLPMASAYQTKYKGKIYQIEYDTLEKEIDQLSEQKALSSLNIYVRALATAARNTLHLGPERLKKLINETNAYLSPKNNISLDEAKLPPSRGRKPQVNAEKLYDFAEILLECHCDHTCSKKADKCHMRKLMKEKNMPMWNENPGIGKCEYKVDVRVAK